MRSWPGSAPSSSTYGRTGAGAITVSPIARASHRVEERRGVAHGAADAELDRQTALVAKGSKRDASLARLQPDEATARGRDANRTAAVARMRERHHARRNGRRGSSARSTRRARDVPRVVGRAPGDRLGGRHAAQLGAVGASGDDESSVTEPTDQRGVRVGDDVRVLQRDVAVADPLARVRRVQILDEERHSTKRATRQRRAARGLAGVIEPTDDHRVQHRVDLLDPFDRRLEQFERRHVAVRDESSLIDRVHPPGVSSQRAHPGCVARSCERGGGTNLDCATLHEPGDEPPQGAAHGFGVGVAHSCAAARQSRPPPPPVLWCLLVFALRSGDAAPKTGAATCGAGDGRSGATRGG